MTKDDHNKPQDKAVKSSSKKQSNSDKSIKKAKRIDKDVQRLQAKELRDVKVEGLKNQDLVADKSHQQLLGEQQALPDETLLTSTKDLTEIDSKQIKEFADAESESESLKPDAASKAIAGAALVEDPLVDDTKASVARVGKGGGGNGASSHWLTTHSLLNHVGATGITSNHSGHVEGSHYKPSVTVQQLTHVNHSQTDQQPAPVMHAEGAQQQSGAVKEDKVSEVSGELHVSGVGANQVSWTVESGSGVYGQLFVDPHTGQWRYQLDNALATTNALAEGEHHSEQFVVVVKDNLQHQIKMVVSIEVEGSNDKPQISGLHHANVTEMAALSEVDGQLFAKDPDHNEQLQWSVSHSQGQYGQLTINPDNGQWQYQLDNQQPATLALTEGQKGVEHFVVSVTDSAGEMVKQDLSIQVLGTNEQAIIGGGFSGVLIEDKDLHQGQLHADGVLTVTDVDNGQNQFQATVQQGQFGSLSINELGHWTYTADNSQTVIQGLKTGESLTDTLVVHSVDGTEQKITVTISGTDDKAVIGGTSTASLTEDKDLHQGQLHVDGTLTVTDLDYGQNQFQAGVQQGQFGSLSINELGHWTYTADNSQAVIQGLRTGESLTDTLVVHSVDGTEQKITVSINGTDDKAVIAGTATASLTEDKDLHQGQLHVDGALTVTDLDNGQNQFQANVLQGQFGTLSINNLGHWTYTADNSQQAIQGLKTGESLTDSLIVHSVDGTEQKITVSINGTDDKAVIAGTSTAQLTEDKDLHSGQLHVDGVLTVTDVDNGQNQFQANVLQGQFGTLSINSLGHWTYTADNSQPVIQGLKTGESLTDTLVVHSVDGTELKITVSINGTDDKAVIAGISTVQLTEDKDLHQGQLHADGVLNVTDVDNGQNQFQAGVQQGQFGSLSINELGHWTYTADNSQPVIQGLKTGESLTDTLVVHSVDGTEQKISVTINGTDDKAVIAGTSTASLTEDKDVHQGQLHVDGSLTVTDVDNGQNQFQANVLQGQFGTLSINNLGHWTYTADNSQQAIQGLKTGESLTDTLVVHSVDGTEQKITVSINGTDDKAVIAGTRTAQLTEDKDLHQGQLHADGVLTVTDVDNGQNQFQATVQQGQFGSLSINELGHWTYTADNSQTVIQGLKTGESLTDTLVVHSVDGTEQKITVTINGTDDKAVIGGTSTASLTEDKDLHQGQLHVDGTLTVTDVDNGQNQFQAGVLQGQFGTLSIDNLGHWTYTADNSQPVIQGLKTGESLTDTLVVHSVDGTEQKITVSINGTDDKAVIAGTSTTQLTEDKDLHQGQLHVDGTLTVTDVDSGQNQFQAGVQQGQFGSLSINELGHWTYTADNSKQAIQGLKTGESLTDTLVVHSVDGTEQKVTVRINGTDDKAIITGITTGDVDEGHGSYGDMSPDYAQPGMAKLGQAALTADGKLDIVDPDSGEAQFDPKGGAWNNSYHGQYGHLLLNTDGTWHYDVTVGSVDWVGNRKTTIGTTIDQLGEGQTLTDTITVYSKDGTAQNIVITIHGDNDRPYISSEVTLTTGTEDTALTFTKADLLSNTVDVDTNDAGKLSIANLLVDHGSVIDNKDGTYTFTPTKDYNGQVHFTYDVQDAHGGVTHTGASTSLSAVGDTAVIGGQDTFTVQEDHNLTLNSGNTIIYNGQLTITDADAGEEHFDGNLHQNQQTGTWDTGYTTQEGGKLILQSDGSYRYEIDNSLAKIQSLASSETLIDTVTVRSADGTTHEIQVTIQGDNDAPVVSSAVTLTAGTEDTDVVLHAADLLANATDIDHDDAGKLSVANLIADHGKITDNHDGTFTFHPTQDYNGKVSFTYDVQDSHGGSVATSASITLAPTRDSAVITGTDTGTIIEDHNVGHSSNHPVAASGLLNVSDPDAGQDHFQVNRFGEQAINDPFGGFLRITPNGAWGYEVANSHLQSLAEGEVEKVVYRVYSADHTAHDITITVTGTNDQPTITATTLAHGTEDTHYQMQASQFGFTDIDTGDTLHSIAITDLPPATQGKFVLDGHDITAGQSIATADIAKLQFVPAQDFNGDVQFKYTVNDGHQDSKEATNTITVDSVNHAPTVAAVTDTVSEDQTNHHQLDLLQGATDTDGDTLSITNLHYQVDGGATSTALPAGVFVASDGHTLVVDATHQAFQHLGVNQSETIVVTYNVTDGQGGNAQQTATLTVTGTNDAPMLGVSQASSTTGTLTETDADVTDSHTFSVVSSTGHFGSLTVNPNTGDYVYTPNTSVAGMSYNAATNSYHGVDVFEVKVSDGQAEDSKFITFDASGQVTTSTTGGIVTSTTVPPQPVVTTTQPTLPVGANVAPTNTVTLDLASMSDSGSSQTDNLTKDTTPTITGHTDIPYSQVTVYDGSTPVGHAVSDASGQYSVAVSRLTEGDHNLSAKALAPSSVVPAVSPVLDVKIDTQAQTSIHLDPITADNIINAQESHTSVNITGQVGGDVHQGDVVTLSINQQSYTGTVDSHGQFSIVVAGSELASDSSVSASVSTVDNAGNKANATQTLHYDTDLQVGRPSITFESPGSDNLYNKAEIAHGHAGTITATVHAATDAKVGEHLSINGVDHVLDANSLAHGIQLEVAPSSIVKAIMTDEHGNVNSALNMAASAKPEPIVVTAPPGSHHIGASLGVPTIVPGQTPVPVAEQGWKILVNGHYQTSYTSHWGTLTIDPKTGQLSYQEHANTHTGPHGSAQDVGVHEDRFEVALQGSHHDDVVMHVQVSILNHGPGHSGKLTLGSEVLDMTVTPVVGHHTPPPAAPDASDAPLDVDVIDVDLVIAPSDELASYGSVSESEHHQELKSETETSDLTSTLQPTSPVDHYFQMLGMSRDDAPSESLAGSQTDLLPEFNVDNPLADEDDLAGHSPDPFDNPLAEGEDQHHQLDDAQDHDHNHNQLVDDNTAMDSHDDELLHSALNNMHNQW
ncbi:VCBS domain-containing protein [Agarivorans sp. Alg241-V36]|uniref:VCBS domain-containing protein n=1 Tax=Agarivorans sp. Alg241-V36 TaxID=2305992 RepID=UPI0013D84B8A|nr:VCBS domain-containing protein [Agarivorans sp. Alg241-V36]